MHLEDKLSELAFCPGGTLEWGYLPKRLPDEPNGTYRLDGEIQGSGNLVVAGNKVYQFGYYGSGEKSEWESLTCLDIESGESIRDRRRQDFISDIVYDRWWSRPGLC